MTAVRGEMDLHIGSATTSTSNGDHYIAYCTPACLYSDLG